MPDPEFFVDELEALINWFNKESKSNTPDFILAKVAYEAMCTFNSALARRDKWYGVRLKPGKSATYKLSLENLTEVLSHFGTWLSNQEAITKHNVSPLMKIKEYVEFVAENREKDKMKDQ